MTKEQATIDVLATRARHNVERHYMSNVQAIDAAADWMIRTDLDADQVATAKAALIASPSLMLKA